MSHSFAAGALAPGNFLIPNMTFVVELMAFVIVLGVLWRYVIPPVQQAMNARQEMARQLVSDREEARQLLEKAQTAYQTAMAGARHEAAQLRAQAEQQRREVVEGASTEAAAGAAEIIARGQAQAEAERRQAIRQLKTELGNAAVDLAEKILGEALADNQRQDRLIERFLNQIEEAANAGRGGRRGDLLVVPGTPNQVVRAWRNRWLPWPLTGAPPTGVLVAGDGTTGTSRVIRSDVYDPGDVLR